MPYDRSAHQAMYQGFERRMEALINEKNANIAQAGEAGGRYYYRPGEILIHTADLDLAIEAGLQDTGCELQSIERGKDGPVLARPFAHCVGDTGVDLPAHLATIRARSRELHPLGGEARVGLNHVYFGQPRFSCAAMPQAPATAPAPPYGSAGEHVTIGLIDTPVWLDHPWLKGHVAALPGGAESGPQVPLSEHAGHGTFAAGIIRRIAPGAKILAAGGLDNDGIGDDRTISDLILKLAARNVKVINMSFGGYTEPGYGPLALGSVIAELSHRTAFVAAAGNKPDGQRLYPAAMKRVYGVGALDGCSHRAEFSNFGTWLDACAPGVDIVAPYYETKGKVEVVGSKTQHAFNGFAIWSGTSFAAPQLAAAVAVVMSKTGFGARTAASRVLALGSFVPDLGIAFSPTLMAEPELAV